MKILVTGGAGFIGANLVERLAGAGRAEVVLLDDLSAGTAEPPASPGVAFVRGDFTDPAILERCLEGVDTVVHLAAVTSVVDSIKDPVRSFEVNVIGTFRLLELARRHRVQRIVNASTGGALLGDAIPPISEAMAPSPMSPYGAAKMAVEGYCSAYAASYGIACASLRFSNIYGPRSAHKKSVVATYIRAAMAGEPLVIYGDGSQQRDYLFVGDLAESIGLAIEKKVSGVYQLGSGRPTSIRELIAALERVIGRKLEIRHEPVRKGEVFRTWCDISKAARDFGYAAPTALERGLEATWKWYLDCGKLAPSPALRRPIAL
jgi:UDP-glucose 4-epimerase